MRLISLLKSRFTPLLLLILLLTSTGAFADTVVVGSLDLNNILAGPGGQDELDLTNITGAGAPANSTTTPLSFSSLELSINGGSFAAVSDLASGSTGAIATGLPQDSITSFVLKGSLNPSSVFFNGMTQSIVPSFSVSYSGLALDTTNSCQVDGTGCPHFDVTTTTTVAGVPEPASLSLCIAGVLAMLSSRRRVNP